MGQPVQNDMDNSIRIWRDLAIQFDGQRMIALQILDGLLSGSVTPEDARRFLSAPPIPAEKILAARVAMIVEARANEEPHENGNHLN